MQQPCRFVGGSLPRSRRPVAKMTTRQLSRLFPPHLCQFGGCSRPSRRFLWRKFATTVSTPDPAAAQFGDKVVMCGVLGKSPGTVYAPNQM